MPGAHEYIMCGLSETVGRTVSHIRLAAGEHEAPGTHEYIMRVPEADLRLVGLPNEADTW